MNREIKKLEKYSADGYKYNCIKRVGSYAIFQQCTYTGYPVGYEVIVIQSNKQKEHAPTTEQWGTYGWSHTRLKNAEAKFLELCRNGGAEV